MIAVCTRFFVLPVWLLCSEDITIIIIVIITKIIVNIFIIIGAITFTI